MNYIEETLGVKTKRAEWDGVKNLPLFLSDEYSIDMLSLGTSACLLLKPADTLPAIGTLKKHLSRIYDIARMPVALELEEISRQRRKTLIEEKIPFVVQNKQLYMPFLGVCLTEDYAPETKAYPDGELLPATQAVLFLFIMGHSFPLLMQDAAKKLEVSSMTVTRAAQQLEDLKLIIKKADGVQKYLTSDEAPRELYERAMPYLINPIKKTVYINKEQITSDMFPSGESALAEISMLGVPTLQTYGYAGQIGKLKSEAQLLDASRQCALEIWRYDPRKMSGTKYPDPLSLAMSLSNRHDERIEMCVDEILEKVWE